MQLLAPAAISAKISGRSAITTDDIKDIGELFLDAKSSASMLEANADKYMQWMYQNCALLGIMFVDLSCLQ